MLKQLLMVIVYLGFASIHASTLPDAAPFQLTVNQTDANHFSLYWQIKPHYFIYQNKIKLTQDLQQIYKATIVEQPRALTQVDSQNNSFLVYRNSLLLTVEVVGLSADNNDLTIHYQGCSDDGFCYPPTAKRINISIAKDLSLQAVALQAPPSVKITTIPASTSGYLSSAFNHHWSIVLLIFFGLGLMLSFTPCILPMVPVISGIIIGHGPISAKRAFLLSLSYVLGMATTYALVGALVALLGHNLQLMMQTPAVIVLFSLVFVLLALSMFDCFEMSLPQGLQTRLTQLSQGPRRGGYISAVVMGCLSTLILSPCVTAPLIAVLSYIAQSGDIVLGALSLFVLSLGMGAPLIIIATSASCWLPKAGRWMQGIKTAFGVVFIMIALYLLARILPQPLMLMVVGIFFIFMGIVAGALVSRYPFKQACGICLLAYGLLLLVGGSMGHDNLLQPLLTTKQSFKSTLVLPKAISSLTELEQALTKAQAAGKPIVLDFYAHWCQSCNVMEQTVFNQADVQQALNQFTLIKIDLTTNNHDQQLLLKKYQVIAPPTFLFLTNDGLEIPNTRLIGQITANFFIQHLAQIAPPVV